MSQNINTELLLSQDELKEMRHSYEQEYIKLLRRLEHLQSILNKLGSELADASAVPAKPAPAEAPKRRRKKKRGPKSIWGDFILNRLKSVDRPMSYAEMLQDAMVMHNIPEEKTNNAKASILNSAFRLRTVHKKIDTVGEEGKKEKYLVLKRWLNDEGALMAPYNLRFDQLLAASKSNEKEEVKTPARRGRPPKSAAKKAKTGLKRGPGRPKGSKNKTTSLKKSPSPKAAATKPAVKSSPRKAGAKAPSPQSKAKK